MARKTVLVTGASRGIGKAIAVKFAKKGWNVVISCVKREEQLLQTKKEIESFQVSCLAFLGDMGKMEDCAALFKKIKKQFGGRRVCGRGARAGGTCLSTMRESPTSDFSRI